MNVDSDESFQDTINWANTISTVKKADNFPMFYIVIGAVILLVFLIIVVLIMSKDEQNSLDILNDEDYETDGIDSDGEFIEEIIETYPEGEYEIETQNGL